MREWAALAFAAAKTPAPGNSLPVGSWATQKGEAVPLSSCRDRAAWLPHPLPEVCNCLGLAAGMAGRVSR